MQLREPAEKGTKEKGSLIKFLSSHLSGLNKKGYSKTFGLWLNSLKI
jgi:hypothetical protein